MARKHLSPLGLAVMTGAARDAIGTPDDGWLIWNSDDEQIERSHDGDWEVVAIEPVVEDLIGVLAVEVARLRSAIRFLDVEPEAFDPDLK
jgi:hypothetical protein